MDSIINFTDMFASIYGESAALFTAFCWTITSLAFESAGKRVGSLSVNIIRLFFAIAIYIVFLGIYRGNILPFDATAHQWIWLSLSGIAGFVIGDLFLFQAFVIIGARLSLLIMSLVPPIAAVLGRIFLNEILDSVSILAMIITVSGIALVILNKKKGEKLKSNIPLIGLGVAFLGAIGQAGGLVLSKYGMGDYDPFASSQIRIFAGAVGFTVMFTIMKKWNNIAIAFKDKQALKRISLGTVFGPFLGVSFSLVAVKYIDTGIAATIMSITPVLIIPAVILLKKEKVSAKEAIGALIAVMGVAILFLKP